MLSVDESLRHNTQHLNSLSQNSARAMWLCMVVLMHAIAGMEEDVKLKAGAADGDARPSDGIAAAIVAASAARAWAI